MVTNPESYHKPNHREVQAFDGLSTFLLLEILLFWLPSMVYAEASLLSIESSAPLAPDVQRFSWIGSNPLFSRSLNGKPWPVMRQG